MDSGSDSEPEVDEIDFKVKAARIFPNRFSSEEGFFAKSKTKVKPKKGKNKKEESHDNSSVDGSSQSRNEGNSSPGLKLRQERKIADQVNPIKGRETKSPNKRALVIPPARKNKVDAK